MFIFRVPPFEMVIKKIHTQLDVNISTVPFAVLNQKQLATVQAGLLASGVTPVSPFPSALPLGQQAVVMRWTTGYSGGTVRDLHPVPYSPLRAPERLLIYLVIAFFSRFPAQEQGQKQDKHRYYKLNKTYRVLRLSEHSGLL
jgi:hypothetical protein